jgi:hypothetical protein
MKDPEALKAVVPEPPLTAAELGGIEATLVGPRLETLIDVLDEICAVRQRSTLPELVRQRTSSMPRSARTVRVGRAGAQTSLFSKGHA